jgi:Uma2 family endonuclease
MKRPAPLHHFTYRQYLDFEEGSAVRHEFLDGEVYGMAGGTPEHAALAANVSALLIGQLRDQPCTVMSSDLRVRVLATGLATYPDVTVVCGPLERDPESRVTVVNPTLIVEVLSEGTEDYDRGEKLLHYRQVPSLECVLVSHRARHIESWRREADGRWTRHEAHAGEALRIVEPACELLVDEVYRRVPIG